MAKEFIQGLQAAQQQTLGQLQIEEAVASTAARVRRGEKAERIQGYLGGYGEATAPEQARMESQVATEDIDMAGKLRSFRTSGDAEMAKALGSAAAVALQSVGTGEEMQALLWFGQQAESAGVPRETVKKNMDAALKNPQEAVRRMQMLAQRGGFADEYLDQYEMKRDIAKEEREEAGQTRLETLKQKGRLELQGAKVKKPTAREQKITDAVTDYGVSEKDARDIVDGRLKVKVDPLTGQAKIINIATGTQKMVGGEAPPTEITREIIPETDLVPEQTVFDVLNEGVGLGATIREGLSTTVGQAFEGQVYPETTMARTKIKGLREKLIRALSLSGRPPVVEQERLVEMLPSTGIFESTGHATAQLTELHSLLSRQMMDDMAVFTDNSKPKKMRGEAAERARGIGGMLRELGTPPEGDTTINTQEEYDALPSGATYIDAETGQKGTKP